MKKIFLLVLLMAFAVLDGVALSFKVDGMDYRLIDGNSECVALVNAKSGTNVTVPDEVAYDGVTYKVTEISDRAFYMLTIDTLKIGNNVVSIAKDAFYVASIRHIDVLADNDYFASFDGVLFTVGYKQLTYYPNKKEDKAFVVPPTATEIGDKACEDCCLLEQIVLPEGLIVIGEQAFHGCSNLTDVNLPSTLEDIGNMAFKDTPWFASQPNGALYCAHLLWGYKGATPENGVFAVRDDCFFVATCFGFPGEVETMRVPASVRKIKMSSDNNLLNFDVVEDNSYYQSIDGVLLSKDGGRLERYPGGRKGVYVVPQGVKTIGSYSFANVRELTRITLPEGVESIEYRAFYWCRGVKRIDLPATLTTIAEKAFEMETWMPMTPKKRSARKGHDLSFGLFCRAATPPEVASIDAFGFNNDELYSFYVPKGSVEAYRNTYPWYMFPEIIEIDFADVNGDGNVNGSDVTALYNELLGGVEAAGVSDVNGDGYVNGADVTALYTRLLGDE